ncbi:MAG: Zn-dependent hydrolase [Burkholderiales bacterium PBB6]|nr:MAG: Zn-dependent hydrolase [Burkholderiales bacterium PBB6]
MSATEEARLHYPFGSKLPPLGEVMEVAPGVRWLRMGLPFALDHINLWLLRDVADDGTPGWAIVDCGIDNPATRAAWQQVFANGLDGLPVVRVIVTHMHPDHIGLAHWLCEHWACRLWISTTDWQAARMASGNLHAFGGAQTVNFFRRHGLTDAATLALLDDRSGYYAQMVPAVPAQHRRLLDGQTLRIGEHSWTTIVGYGHAPEHMALHCAALGVLISGDMVLPRISTNVSVIDLEPEADPLTLYLQSLQRYLPLADNTLVLPSHGKPFVGLHERISQLQQHHEDRFVEVVAACAAAPQSAADLLPVLFKRALDAHQTTFAMGESVAHLHALLYQGRLRVVHTDDGVIRFSTP